MTCDENQDDFYIKGKNTVIIGHLGGFAYDE
jgi:hypothetical protein